MKKTIRNFVFVILFASSLFSFSACGSELDSALNKSNFSNVKIEINTSASEQTVTQEVDGSKVKNTSGDAAQYLQKAGNDYYLYSNKGGKWRKEEYTYFISRFGETSFTYANLIDFEARDFAKDGENYSMTEAARQAYCERIFVKQWESLGAQVNFAEVEYLTLKMTNGKVSEVELKYSLILGEQPVQSVTLTLSLSDYGSIHIELPEAEEIPLITSIQEQFQWFEYRTTVLTEQELDANMKRGFTAEKYYGFYAVIEYQDELTAQNSLNKYEDVFEESICRGRYVCYASGESQSAFSLFENFF